MFLILRKDRIIRKPPIKLQNKPGPRSGSAAIDAGHPEAICPAARAFLGRRPALQTAAPIVR